MRGMNRRDFLRVAALTPAIGASRPLDLDRAKPAQSPAPPAPSDPRLDEIASVISEKMTAYHVPGVGFGLVKDGQLTVRGFGVTSVDDPQPITPDTIFTIASISKTVTATAIMRLVEQGRMDLDAPVQKYLPDFRVQDETASRTVTIRHLLTHTPGWEGQLSSEDRGVDALAHFATTILREVPQLAAPGQVWSYNNAGFSLAGRVIEVVTGRGIHDALRELVFTPIGLPRMSTRIVDAITHPLSLGHREQGGRTQVLRPFQTTSGPTAGGVLTSVSDLMKYARFHLGDIGAANGQPWIAPAALEQMKTPQVRKNSTTDEMGVGWHLRRLGGVLTAAHGGTLNGHCLLLELVPARRLAFAILTNHTDGWRLIQDVEQSVLKRYEQIALAPNQAIGHRGVNEAMSFHSTPLAAQPPLDEYAGTYRRAPNGSVSVRVENGSLIVAQGTSSAGATLTFYARDAAYATAGAYLGTPYEFVRDGDTVRWIRINGRIARKDG
jgi:CubicO group peptidase (beta-lactamase class C family)